MAVYCYLSGLGLFQAAQKGQKSCLADSVFTEKAINPAFFKSHRDVSQHYVVPVAESEVFNFYHIPRV